MKFPKNRTDEALVPSILYNLEEIKTEEHSFVAPRINKR